jgi:hypothetical protein
MPLAEWIDRECQCAAKGGLVESRRVMPHTESRVVIEEYVFQVFCEI